MNENHILIISQQNKFEKNLIYCLRELGYQHIRIKYAINEKDFNHKTDIVILNLLQKENDIEKLLKTVAKHQIKKIILLENANTLYLNSKNVKPYSVYKKIIPKNSICKKCRNIEEQIMKSGIEFVIFRTSEIYGAHTDYGIIFDLLNNNKVVLNRGQRDFIYEGDVIHAIEVALEEHVKGIFNIAYGQSIELKKLVKEIDKHRKTHVKVIWNRKKEDIIYNHENFKFYKWQPVVDIQTGLNATKRLITEKIPNCGGENNTK